MKETVFIAFGSNLNAPIDQLVQARKRLVEKGLQEIGASRLYRSAPWGYREQNDFYNAVVAYHCPFEALSLLTLLQEVETEQGRERPFKNAPRTLDLDILLYGHKNIAHSRLTVPHPAISQRIFVLAPLADLDPQLEINGQKVMDLLGDLPWEGIEVIESQSWQPIFYHKGECNE